MIQEARLRRAQKQAHEGAKDGELAFKRAPVAPTICDSPANWKPGGLTILRTFGGAHSVAADLPLAWKSLRRNGPSRNCFFHAFMMK